MGIDFVGCEPIETNDNGQIINRHKLPKGYTKDYISMMKNIEQDLLNQKTIEMKDQNHKYYSEKCLELIANSENDSFCKAAANIMLNSGSEYLFHL